MGIGADIFATTHQCDSELGVRYLSDQNLNIVQGQLRKIFHDKTGYVIGRQSDEDVAYIMRVVYLQNANHVAVPVQKEIERLNAIVLGVLVPMVATNVSMYLGYLRDASRLPTPLDRPVNQSIKGRNTWYPLKRP